MTEILLALFVVLGTAWQTPQALQESEIAAAIAAGDRGEGLLPFVLGYGGAADPYVIALAYPPEVRLALASNAAHRSGRVFRREDATAQLIAPVVYLAVESREKMAAVSRSEPKAKPERLLVLPKPESPLSEGIDAEEIAGPASVMGGIVPKDFDGRVFVVPASDWRRHGYVVFFEEPVLSTAGESGRERRCWVYGPVRQ